MERVLPLPNTATALATDGEVPLPPTRETVGVDVYPEPCSVNLIPVTLPFETYAVALAPLPPPPVINTLGASV